MKVLLFHDRLDVWGGTQRVFLATLEALYQMGFQIDIVTLYKPIFRFLTSGRLNIEKLTYALPHRVRGLPSHIRGFFPLYLMIRTLFEKADLIVQTSGVDIPLGSFIPPIKTVNNPPRIIYVHSCQSSAVFSKEISNEPLIEKIYNISYVELYRQFFQRLHDQAILNSLVITSAYCWADRIKSLYPSTKPLVIYPPVDVDKFSPLANVPRDEKIVLTLARIDPSKQLHKVILLSKQMQTSDIKFVIVGSLTDQYVPYYQKLNKLINQLDVRDRVKILVNVSGKQLIDLMRKSSIFFYASPDGFPIAKVEAMAAGLIPVVPDLCGVNEGVPREYRFRDLKEAARIIEDNINAPVRKRVELSEYAKKFSKYRFKTKLKLVISKVLDIREEYVFNS